MRYTKQVLQDKLIELKNKYGYLSSSMIDNEPNFPTRKVFKRFFGTLEEAFKSIGYNTYRHGKFDINLAQKKLDETNGNFTLLEFKTVNDKNLTMCRICGYKWKVCTQSLFGNHTLSHGCPNCIKNIVKQKLLDNGFLYISNNGAEYTVQCLKCGYIFDGFLGNLEDSKCNCQNCSKVDNHKYKLSNLLNETLQAYYILGFIMADGHIDRRVRLHITINKKDLKLLQDIESFFGLSDSISERDNNKVEFNVADAYTLGKISEMYNIDQRKTYNPCDISSLTGDKLTAFIIGFIDGDGTFGYRTDTKSPRYIIKLHKSWESNLNYIVNHLYNSVKIKNIPHAIDVVQPGGTYTSITIGNQNVIKYLNNFIINNKLFVLDRKWNLNTDNKTQN